MKTGEAAAPGRRHDRPTSVDHVRLTAASIELVTGLQAPSGAYPASPTFSAYRGYCWLRDGAFIAEAASRWQRPASASRFHDWVNTVLRQREPQIQRLVAAVRGGAQPDPADLLPTRFTLLGSDGDDPWWDFQTDGYGTWLWSVHLHAQRHQADTDRWQDGIKLAVDYLTAVGDQPCYDWWEENADHRHTSTLAAVAAGLTAAAANDTLDGDRRAAATKTSQQLRDTILQRGTVTADPAVPNPAAPSVTPPSLAKWLGSSHIDASLAACIVPFGILDIHDPIATATLDAITEQLDVNHGVHRYAADVYYGGGQWPLLSCLLGWNRAAAGDRHSATAYLDWTAALADHNHELPEQVDQHLLNPDHMQPWLDRWGTVAQPLLWSHAMYLILADELGYQKDSIT